MESCCPGGLVGYPRPLPAGDRPAEGRGRIALDQSRAPYFEALAQYLTAEPLTFHIPGHQHGEVFPDELSHLIHSYGAAADITEVLGIDDIHNPHRQVKEAEELAAQAFGASATKFLVNGSTVGNQAMLLSTLGPGDLVLAPQSVHRSFFSGLLLSGAKAQLFGCDVHPELFCLMPPRPEQVESALQAFPETKALFLTSPIYHGACAELTEIISLAKKRGVLVLVDEAWGAHLPFCPELPSSAVQCGADLVVHSLHKSASGLTPTALLHFCPDTVERGRLETVLRHLQTSSPSSLLVASIDCARRRLAQRGEEEWGRIIREAQRLEKSLNEIPGLRCFPKDPQRWDPCKLSLDATELGYSGHQLAESLREHHRLQVEMSEAFGVLLALSPGHGEKHFQGLLASLKALPTRSGVAFREKKRVAETPLVSLEPRCTVREAFHARSTAIPLRKAVDRTCAELLYCYPPGVPVVFPGQPLSAEVVEFIETQKAIGSSVQGGVDPELGTIQVLEEKR